MAVSNALASVLKEVAQLEKKLTGLESRCDALEGQHQMLTEELGKARLVIQELVKELSRNRKLVKKRQKLIEEDNRVGDDKANVVWRRSPLEIFPAETWTMILNLLGDPKDLKSCYKAHPDFQSMLEKQRTTFLFDDVVKLLVSNVEGFGGSRWYVSSKQSPLINCRLVCHHWKQVVDQFLQQESRSFTSLPESNFVMPTFHCYRPVRPTREGSREDERRQQILKALNWQQNPMPSRYLTYTKEYEIVPPVLNFNNAFRETLHYDFDEIFTRFLKKFGGDVLTLQLRYGTRNETWRNGFGYIPLVNLLNMTPNLRELHLRESLFDWWNFDETQFTRDNLPMENDQDDMSEMIPDDGNWFPSDYLERGFQISLQKMFPHLPTLKRIVFTDCPPALINRTVTANEQVEQLKISLYENDWKKYDPSKLQVCHLKLTEAHLSFRNAWNILADWPLVKLTLHDANLCDWSQLSQLGNEGGSGTGFAKTLKELDLTLCGPGNSAKHARLNLPALRVLKLKLSQWFHPIDFILPLVNLEHLELDFSSMCKTKFGREVPGFKPLTEIVEIIQIHGYIDNLKQSNVWKLLPKLKEVKARTDWNKEANGECGWEKTKYSKWYVCRSGDF